ncbi:MAG: phosphatidate cytidylyltransferase [Woeseiaceae bacterium]
MLKQRIITALILMPLAIWSILSASSQSFTYGLAVVLFIASLEWNSFVAYRNKAWGYVFSIAVTASFLMLEYLANIEFIKYVVYLSLVWWLLSLPLLFDFPFPTSHALHQKPVKIIIGFILLLSTFLAFSFLRNSYGTDYVMYFLWVIWFADSGAYFAGRAWGKHKLIPKVSPGKSWEGIIGGMVATFVVAYFALDVLQISSNDTYVFISITMVTFIYSVIGDLSESMFKRMANVKDSGKILPGHGGILDRIDSLTSGLPVFLAGLWLMESMS